MYAEHSTSAIDCQGRINKSLRGSNRLNDSGFALLTFLVILIGSSLLVLTAYSSQNTQLSLRFKSSRTQANEFKNLISQIHIVLKNQDLCVSNFAGKPLNPSTSAFWVEQSSNVITMSQVSIGFPDIHSGAFVVFASSNNSYGRLIVTNLSFASTTEANLLTLQVEAKSGLGGQGHTFHAQIPVYVMLDSSGLVINCFATIYVNGMTLENRICGQNGKIYDAKTNACL